MLRKHLHVHERDILEEPGDDDNDLLSGLVGVKVVLLHLCMSDSVISVFVLFWGGWLAPVLKILEIIGHNLIASW